MNNKMFLKFLFFFLFISTSFCFDSNEANDLLVHTENYLDYQKDFLKKINFIEVSIQQCDRNLNDTDFQYQKISNSISTLNKKIDKREITIENLRFELKYLNHLIKGF